MTYRQAHRRMRQTSTPERVVRYRLHEEGCPARGGADTQHGIQPMGCRCSRRRYGYGVVLDGHTTRTVSSYPKAR